MHTAGHDFMPPAIHAGGLRYHGNAPINSQLLLDGIIRAEAISQLETFEAGVAFARCEGFITAPETNHALAMAIREAKKAKEEGKEKVILFNWSGHGLIDLGAYEAYNSGKLEDYLDQIGLPTENVLVSVKERGKVIFIMPSVVENLNNEQKKRALYISKFIASCSVGLFDAALNFLWNETILNLRGKIVRFDMDYFYDSTIKDASNRSNFKNEEDLENISDWDLIRGCKATGIITDIGYKHLDYIRDMRNFASAAHPNHNQLTGLQVVTWLETCILEVLAKDPSGPVLEVKRLLHNIRTETLEEKDIEPIRTNIRKLPGDLANSLLRAIFGMYCDNNLSQNIRENIDLISKRVWSRSDEDAKYDIGIKYATFSINGDIQRKEFALKFLSNVNGQNYLTEEQRSIEIGERLDNLLKTHYEFYNFDNEKPHAKMLLNYIPESGIIPKTVRYKYVKVIIICRLGNSYGVSFVAKPYYDKMFKMFRDEEILKFLELLKDTDIITILDYNVRYKIFISLAKCFENKTNDEIIKQALSLLQESPRKDITNKKTYREINKLIKGE